MRLRRLLCVTLLAAVPLCAQDTAAGRTVSSLPLPAGCTRLTYPDGSFSRWVQALPLRESRAISRFDGGRVAEGTYNVLAVVDMLLLFKQDLEQCADWAMRLWAEWHKADGTLSRLYLFDYNGKRKPFAASGKSYTQFLKQAFANTNSYSLKTGCRPASADSAQPGDLVVQNERGGVGHVSVVMDACTSATGQRYYLMGYSYMPAQEFHLEQATAGYGTQDWFTLDGYFQFLRDNVPLGEPVLRRWPGP